MRLKKEHMRKERERVTILSCLVLLLIGIMFFIIQYYQLLRGDDVLFQYEHSHYWYTQLKEWWPAERITNVAMLINEVWERWLYFSGRFSTVIFVPALNILGQGVCSLIGSVVYTLFIICMGKIIWGSWKEVFYHPFGLFIIYLLQFQFSPTASYMQMWTFVCHYSMPIVLCMLYYIFWIEGAKVGFPPKLLVLLNVFGVYVGATHELLPLYCFILIGIKGLIIYRKEFVKPLMVSNSGIVLGYLFVVVAPGNLVRMGIEHDKRRIETGIVEKLYISLKAHVRAWGLENLIVKILFLLAILIVVVAIYKNRENVKNTLINTLEFIVAAMLSVILWAIVAPPVAQYSMPFFKAIVLIIIFKILNIKVEYSKKYLLFTGVTISIWVLMNISWCSDLINTTTYRRNQIETAVEEGKSEVVLIDYPESTANYFTEDNVANILGAYDAIIDADFYGIRIMTTEDFEYTRNEK